jgi:ribosomal protein S18 acetylase RimI-like enzyme
MKLDIRPIHENDFPTLITLFQEFAVFEKQPDKMSNSVEQMEAEKDHIHGFVAVSASREIVGYVTFFFAYYTWSGKSLYMDDLYVKPNYRHQGVGKKLINQVINLAKTENCKKLRWQVSAWNQPAIDFYKSLGATIDTVELNCDLIFR